MSRNKSFSKWHFVRVRRVTATLQDCRGQELGIQEQRDLLELKVGGLMRRDGWRALEPRIPENSNGSNRDRYSKSFECVSGNMEPGSLKDRILVSLQW